MPSHVVFDVNETLSDMASLSDRFAEIGAPSALAPLWFASVLSDGFALTVTGDTARFAVIGAERLRSLLDPADLSVRIGDAVAHILAGFGQLDVHPDVPDGVRQLRAGGLTLVTLSNGAADVAETLLRRVGLSDEFEQFLSVDDAGAWKPARAAYLLATEACAVDAAEMVLVAVHPWDIHGATHAGMRTAWINRTGAPYPSYFSRPEFEASTIGEFNALLHR